ncbi:C40 family peptidase [Flaviaesturariibacter amylovorans]|uniref:C40 family peptidase n=1 Tax=Flaviaesturariibacter amylovorans TaxID=1084520 RepID=A0ABP8GGZ9_9BACT
MEFAFCAVPVAPVRGEAAHRGELVSQLLFGEPVQVLEEAAEWRRIRGLIDGYEGWVTALQLTATDEALARLQPAYVCSDPLNPLTGPDGLYNLPMGAFLPGYDPETRLLWDGEHKYHGLLRDRRDPFDADLLWRTAHAFRNAPYLWGGKTVLGVDCSGFVQTVFRLCGIGLLRDAYQQAEQGQPVSSVEEARFGDLAFFHNEKGRVTHVGIVLGEGGIIHAAGKVRVDELRQEGIVRRADGVQTHPLHSIRRVLG